MTGTSWTILTGFCGFIVTLLGIYIRVSYIIKERSKYRDKSRRQEIHSEITIPVDKLKDNVADLRTTVHEFIDREIEDHQDVVNIMTKSNKSHKQMLNIMERLDTDSHQISNHDKIIEHQTHKINVHDKAIADLKRTKADKKKRGNQK